MNSIENQYKAKAFLSCSLRDEDKKFVDLVANILKHFDIQPFGTVGRYDTSTDSPIELMKKNIELSDIVVVAATKRYLTIDNHHGKKSNTISEMIHSEIGMAVGNSKPVVVFVEEGTNIGNFIPSITQYITLDNTPENFNSQYHLISSLLKDAYNKSVEIKNNKSWKNFGNILLGGLAIYGGFNLLNNDENDDKC
jgi:hypothetical protein